MGIQTITTTTTIKKCDKCGAEFDGYYRSFDGATTYFMDLVNHATVDVRFIAAYGTANGILCLDCTIGLFEEILAKLNSERARKALEGQP